MEQEQPAHVQLEFTHLHVSLTKLTAKTKEELKVSRVGRTEHWIHSRGLQGLQAEITAGNTQALQKPRTQVGLFAQRSRILLLPGHWRVEAAKEQTGTTDLAPETEKKRPSL